MKKEDIKDGYVLLRNDEGELKLGEDNNPIKLEVSERTVEILNKAAEEKFYHVYYEEGKGKRVETFDIIENDYVIRPSKTKVKDILQPIKQHVITRRVNALCELAGKQHLTPKNIVRSGHIYYGFKIWDEAGRPNFSDGY
jgi:hypothetical protein